MNTEDRDRGRVQRLLTLLAVVLVHLLHMFPAYSTLVHSVALNSELATESRLVILLRVVFINLHKGVSRGSERMMEEELTFSTCDQPTALLSCLSESTPNFPPYPVEDL